MKMFLTLYPGSTITELERVRKQVTQLLAAYEPRPVGRNGYKIEMRIAMDDPALPKALKQVAACIPKTKVVGWNDFLPEPTELARARFAPFVFFGHAQTSDPHGHPLNRFPHVLCKTCRFPDVSRPPNPLLLAKAPPSSAEILHAPDAVLVVRPRVLEMLRAAIGPQIEVGDVRVQGQAKTASAADRLHWVRPVHRIGDAIGKSLKNPCPACGRPLESRGNPGDRRVDPQFGPRVTHFGPDPADLALLDGYFGSVGPDGTTHWHWDFAISGALFTHLKENGVKGISTAPGDTPAACYFSAKGEPAFEPARRTFAGGAVRPPGRAPLGGVGAAASSNDVTWGVTDGYVYFHLSTAELVVVDPMSFEEDAGGPYTVKNFKPGVYRLPTRAIRPAKGKRGVAVDSGTLLLIDGAFCAGLAEAFDWTRTRNARGSLNLKYLDKVARNLGTRFGLCEVSGDGNWMIDVKEIERVACSGPTK